MSETLKDNDLAFPIKSTATTMLLKQRPKVFPSPNLSQCLSKHLHVTLMISKIVQIKALPKMERLAESGSEVKLSTSPEVAAQPHENKYYIGDEGSH